MKKAKWIWHFGDFECLHLKKVNYRRTEREYPFPPFWKQPEIYSCVRFRKEIEIEKAETITVYAKGKGFVTVGEERYPFETPIMVEKGKYLIEVLLCNENGLPCIFVQGDTVVSDESWECCTFDTYKKAGCNDKYTSVSDDPNVFKFSYEKLMPVTMKKLQNGALYDFGEETFAVLKVIDTIEPFTVYFGETEQEALDKDNAYLFQTFTKEDIGKTSKAFGFRYVFIPDGQNGQPHVEVYYEYLPEARNPKAKFTCSDEMLNKIWQIAGHTFELNSREFYLDGIKRDRWVWSGDSYQCYFTDRYYAFEKETAKRTIIAFAGKEKITQHINTINDYTFYWIISVYDYYVATGDKDFVKQMLPRMQEYLDFCISRLDEDGLVVARENDWIYIDWAELDKTGPLCAEQMLLMRSIEVFCRCADLIGQKHDEYIKRAESLKETINEKFWDEEKGAYIDGFTSGERNVTRHANIFAVLFDIATETQKESIIQKVFLNEKIPPITTPYFKFYELEAICQSGQYEDVLQKIKAYWGEMVEAGATSFWEEFKCGTPWQEQLSMYGQKYGKSLCHAWGATPIYIIGRHILGVYPTQAGYKNFCVEPHLEGLESVNAVVPVNGGVVEIIKNNQEITVCASIEGGTFILGNERISLTKGKKYEFIYQ